MSRIVIPTLFKFEKLLKQPSGNVGGVLVRVYDNNIRDKYMKKEYVYNALLPYFPKSAKAVYRYQGDGNMQFLLPVKPNNRMLFMKLIGDDEAVTEYEDKWFAKAIFFSKADKEFNKNQKGSVEFNCDMDAYGELEELKEEKYLIMEDHSNNKKYVFECWIEQLPVPGMTEGIYAYVDGSSGDKNRPEGIGSGCVVNIGKEIYLAHWEGSDSGRNVSAEYFAATKVFEHFPREMKELKEIYIYYDNNNVGYVPADLYNPASIYGQDYAKAIKAFEKDYPEVLINFIHTDGHSGIYGNEMADQVAEWKTDALKDLPAGYQEERAKLCPEDGSYSTALSYVLM